MHINSHQRLALLIAFFLGLAIATGIVLSAHLYAQTTASGSTTGASSSTSVASSAPSSVTCTLTITGNKSTFTPSEDVPYTYTCSEPAYVIMEVVLPDGSVLSAEAGMGPYTNHTSYIPLHLFLPNEFVLGNYSLRMCLWGQGCLSNSFVSVPFTISSTPTLAASSAPSSVTCTLILAGNKSTYTTAETVMYTYMCSQATTVVVQVVKPDGSVTTYNTGTNVTTNTMGFGTSNLAGGNHTLRICVNDTGCSQNSIVSVPFTVTSASSSSSYSLRPTSGSASTVTNSSSSRWSFSSPAYVPVRTGSGTTASSSANSAASAAVSNGSYPSYSSTSTPYAPTMPTTGSSSLTQQFAPQRPSDPASQQLADESARPLTKSQIRTLSSRRKTILRELIVLHKTLKLKRNKDALAQLEALRADVKAFEPVDTSAYETMLDFQDELSDLRIEAVKKPVKRGME